MLEGYSEFLPDEVALIMNCSRAEATKLTEAALILVHGLSDTWAALADGGLNWPRARAIAAEIVRHGPELEAHVLAEVEAVVLPQAAELPVSGLRALLRAELIKRDAEAADRRRKQAEAAADVRLRRSTHDGMAEVVTVLPQPVAAAVYGRVDTWARQAKADGDPRPIGRIRAEVMAALALRPGTTTFRRSPPSCTCSPRSARCFRTRPTRRPVASRRGSPRWRANRSPPPTCVPCSPRWMRSVPAGCRRRLGARCTWTYSAPAATCSPP